MSSQFPAGFKGKASTPSESSRLSLTYSLSDGAKKRVRDIDPNRNKCLVENHYEQRSVNFAHVCPRRFANREDKMDSVEWYWNMAHQTLNLDTRWNIIRLGAAIHRLLDEPPWMLVPEESIVDRYYNSLVHNGVYFLAIRENFPDIENRDDFKYIFMPIDSRVMSKIALLRQNDPPKNDPNQNDAHQDNPRHLPPLPESMTSNEFVVHTYPFDTMPVLISHVHPKFVILQAGLAISMLPVGQLIRIIDKYPVVGKIIHVYQAWTGGRPNNWMKDPTYNLPNPDPGNGQEVDADSEYTERTRTKPQNRQRHQGGPETSTPSPQTPHEIGSDTQGKWRALKLVSSVCLSKKSLELHDGSVGTGNWTNEAIQKWSKGHTPQRSMDTITIES